MVLSQLLAEELQAPLDDLPDEALSAIARNLPVSSVCSLARASSRLHRAVQADASLWSSLLLRDFQVDGSEFKEPVSAYRCGGALPESFSASGIARISTLRCRILSGSRVYVCGFGPGSHLMRLADALPTRFVTSGCRHPRDPPELSRCILCVRNELQDPEALVRAVRQLSMSSVGSSSWMGVAAVTAGGTLVMWESGNPNRLPPGPARPGPVTEAAAAGPHDNEEEWDGEALRRYPHFERSGSVKDAVISRAVTIVLGTDGAMYIGCNQVRFQAQEAEARFPAPLSCGR